MTSWLKDARIASRLTPEQCAVAIGCSRNTYMNRENAPGTLSLNEILSLYSVFNDKSVSIVWNALKDFSS